MYQFSDYFDFEKSLLFYDTAICEKLQLNGIWRINFAEKPWSSGFRISEVRKHAKVLSSSL